MYAKMYQEMNTYIYKRTAIHNFQFKFLKEIQPLFMYIHR